LDYSANPGAPRWHAARPAKGGDFSSMRGTLRGVQLVRRSSPTTSSVIAAALRPRKHTTYDFFIYCTLLHNYSSR
jgi:hypothetical protein